MDKPQKRTWLIEIALLIILAAIAYLTQVNRLSYFREDWFYIYDATVAGPGIFHQMFEIDRPARGYFFEIYFLLFGPNPLAYHLSAFVWRIFAGLGALWLFHLLWPNTRMMGFSMAALLVLFPGYVWWVGAVEWQPHIASLTLEVLSIALSVKAIQTDNLGLKTLLTAVSIISGWAYILLVDYAIGMELFRFLCIYFVVRRANEPGKTLQLIVRVVRASLPYLAVPAVFLFWRIFFFNNQHKSTDIEFQLGFFLAAPLERTILWGNHLWISILNLVYQSWWMPLQQNFSALVVEARIIATFLAFINIIVIFFGYRIISRSGNPEVDRARQLNKWSTEAIQLGFFGMIIGLAPVILANRFVAFRGYSHYGLPASLAVVIFIIGLCSLIPYQFIKYALIALLVGSSTLTHQALAASAVREEQIIKDFWWQVYWRVPSIREGTLLAANYPSIDLGDDAIIVGGPAKFMFFPNERQLEGRSVRYKLGAVDLSNENLKNIQEGNLKHTSRYRSHVAFINFGNVLVFTQPSIEACVRVIDNRWSELSPMDMNQIKSILPYSDINLIDLERSVPQPLEYIFGREPSHSWCYYYQRADHSRQQGDWESVAKIGNAAIEAKVSPTDLVEWLPFIEAYAFLGDATKTEQVAGYLIEDPYYKKLACENIHLMPANGFPIEAVMQEQVDLLLCSP
jgi:hypothetical protein